MNWRLIRAIAIKDLKEVRQNRMAWLPAIIVPLIFVVVLPMIFMVIPRSFGGMPSGEIDDMAGMITPALSDELRGLNVEQLFTVLMLGYLLSPMFLILPLMFAGIVGAESFVGEKERKTLEALLYSPASDTELFLGKVIASVIPAIALSLLCFAAYAIVLNVAGWETMGRIWFPLPHWWPMMLWVAPAVATLAMSASVIVSTRVSTFMAAYQFSGALVLPLMVLLVGQTFGLFSLTVGLMLGVGLVIWILDAVLIRIGLRIFRRSELIARI